MYDDEMVGRVGAEMRAAHEGCGATQATAGACPLLSIMAGRPVGCSVWCAWSGDGGTCAVASIADEMGRVGFQLDTPDSILNERLLRISSSIYETH